MIWLLVVVLIIAGAVLSPAFGTIHNDGWRPSLGLAFIAVVLLFLLASGRI